ncbi:MAG: hypothetical protein GKR97_20630 [Rhizobiaceae bacterium]|nr:hypothetical protein [Rhizobiaceae bacterium]
MKKLPLRFVIIYVGLVACGMVLGSYLVDYTSSGNHQFGTTKIHAVFGITMLVYVFASAVPFVPGAEIGFLMLAMFGASVAGSVYLCMVGALLLAYYVGRLCPPSILARVLNIMGLQRAGAWVKNLKGSSHMEVDKLVASKVDGKFTELLFKNRYIALALILNLPGNSLLGGGGGLAMMAGASKLYSPGKFFVTIAVAVAPIPLVVYLTELVI